MAEIFEPIRSFFGSSDYSYGEPEAHPLVAALDEGNIVDKLDKLKNETRQEVYQDIIDWHDDAETSMDDWKKEYQVALWLAKMQANDGGKRIKTKNFPFKNASTAMLPYVLEAMVDFNARSVADLVYNSNLINLKIYGNEKIEPDMPDELKKMLNQRIQQKEARADRVNEFMTYQLDQEIPHWKSGQDKGLMALPCVGTFYKYTYRDYEEGIICSDLVMADKVKFDMNYSEFDEAPHKFMDLPLSRKDLITKIRSNEKWDIDEDKLEEDKDDFEFIKAFTWIDLDGDGVVEPYCAVLWPEKEKIVCLYPNYDEDTLVLDDDGEVIKVKDLDCFTQYKFMPDPEGGPMGLGWGILMGATFTALNTNLRQIINANTLHNASANSGMIAASAGEARGNRQLGGPVDVILGQLTPVPMTSLNGSLSNNIVQFPFSGATPTALETLRFLGDHARIMMTSANQVEAVQGEAASLYLARLQQGLKVPNAIAMRVYLSEQKEFRKIFELNHKHYDDELYNRVLDEPVEYSMREDFNPDDCDIRLAADPSQGSDIERTARAEANLSVAERQAAAGISVIDPREATLDMLRATKTPDTERLAPPPDPNAKSDQEKYLEMETAFREREMRLKEAELNFKQHDAAMKAVAEARKAGLQVDKDEAEIQKKYIDSLCCLMEMGMSDGQALQTIRTVERGFIDNEPINQLPNNRKPLETPAR